MGGFYQNSEQSYFDESFYYGTGSGGDTTTIKENTFSLFGQAGYTFSDRLTVTPGVRYDYDKKEYDNTNSTYDASYELVNSQNRDSEDWHALSPRLAVDYKISNNHMVYANAARSYKAGGYAMSSSGGDPESAKFDPEDARSIEAGTKTSWMKNRVKFNFAGYYTAIDNMQIFYFDPATYLHIYSNVGEAVIYGLESEIGLQPFHSFEIGIPLGWTHAEITKHADESYEGNKAPMVPEYTAGLFAQYNHRIGLFVRGESNYIGKTYFDEANTTSQTGYVVLNGKFGYKHEHFAVSGYVNNILNEEYYTYRVSAGLENDLAVIAPPRTFGIEASTEF